MTIIFVSWFYENLILKKTVENYVDIWEAKFHCSFVSNIMEPIHFFRLLSFKMVTTYFTKSFAFSCWVAWIHGSFSLLAADGQCPVPSLGCHKHGSNLTCASGGDDDPAVEIVCLPLSVSRDFWQEHNIPFKISLFLCLFFKYSIYLILLLPNSLHPADWLDPNSFGMLSTCPSQNNY